MLLIADSGSSKTDWLLIDKTEKINIKSSGINPFFQNPNEIYNTLNPFFNTLQPEKIQEVFFYGAGCIKNKTDYIVADALKLIFKNAAIEINDDMLGAARAVLGKQAGIACILGTGANSCLYDGRNIIDKVPTLGYILGDEGSGAHIGKLFLNDYFKRAIPAEMKQKIDNELQLDLTEILSAVYKEEYPSRFLGTFSQFLGRNKNHSYTQNLLKRSFTEFFVKNIERYENHKNTQITFVGSIAHNYADFLKEVANERGVTLGKIIEKPIDGLTHFHTTSK